ncbi:GGDEF domain-containing protein [Proteinivorax hydrogeniformans]|uniref:GGDEF domain-containing protein n=1 Tax=Proteinivorax hydrogeniformans TaxID=1826727 RepID=A0AAU8HUM3_9FIRM
MSISQQNLEKVVEKLTSFDKMYQIMRIIDPIKKKVLINKGGDIFTEKEESCYSFWTKNTVCQNCVSTRAYNEDDTIIKMEYTDDKVFMTTAVPVNIGHSKVVVELLKDVTKSMVLGEGELKDSIEMKFLLDKANLAVVTDELTKVYNKRYIMERLPVELLTTHISSEPLSIIMGDIDHFKNVNDTYGHSAGDYVLREFALRVKNNTRENKGWVARFGGEEFLICLPGTDKKEALKIADRVRRVVKEKEFSYKDINIKLTSSFGVVTAKEANISDYDHLIEAVDKNLYQAKQNGRDCVVG